MVDAARLSSFGSEWERRWQRPPTREELDGVVSAFVREDILYRQAVAMGLNEDDPITRRRMAQKLEFLTADLAMMKQPAEGELEQYFRDNQANYRAPDQISFSQVFFDPDARDEATLYDSAVVLVQPRSSGAPGRPVDSRRPAGAGAAPPVREATRRGRGASRVALHRVERH